jgi:hypothetical protein
LLWNFEGKPKKQKTKKKVVNSMIFFFFWSKNPHKWNINHSYFF